jgi:hypothetical protein
MVSKCETADFEKKLIIFGMSKIPFTLTYGDFKHLRFVMYGLCYKLVYLSKRMCLCKLVCLSKFCLSELVCLSKIVCLSKLCLSELVCLSKLLCFSS